MQEVIKEPAGGVVEGNAGEIVEGGGADPEASAVVAEEVFGEGDCFSCWAVVLGDAVLGV